MSRGGRAGCHHRCAALMLAALAGPDLSAADTARGVVLEAHAGSPVSPAAPPAEAARDLTLLPAGESAAAAPATGPGVELITGGQSRDGAARVGRLPVLD